MLIAQASSCLSGTGGICLNGLSLVSRPGPKESDSQAIPDRKQHTAGISALSVGIWPIL